MTMILLTTTTGAPILINEHGLIIEPENDSSAVTLPHEHYRGNKSRIVVKEAFADIAHALEEGNHLIRVTSAEQRAAILADLTDMGIFPDTTKVMEMGLDAFRVTEEPAADPEPVQEPEHVLAEAEIGPSRAKRGGRRKA